MAPRSSTLRRTSSPPGRARCCGHYDPPEMYSEDAVVSSGFALSRRSAVALVDG